MHLPFLSFFSSFSVNGFGPDHCFLVYALCEKSTCASMSIRSFPHFLGGTAVTRSHLIPFRAISLLGSITSARLVCWCVIRRTLVPQRTLDPNQKMCVLLPPLLQAYIFFCFKSYWLALVPPALVSGNVILDFGRGASNSFRFLNFEGAVTYAILLIFSELFFHFPVPSRNFLRLFPSPPLGIEKLFSPFYCDSHCHLSPLELWAPPQLEALQLCRGPSLFPPRFDSMS